MEVFGFVPRTAAAKDPVSEILFDPSVMVVVPWMPVGCFMVLLLSLIDSMVAMASSPSVTASMGLAVEWFSAFSKPTANIVQDC